MARAVIEGQLFHSFVERVEERCMLCGRHYLVYHSVSMPLERLHQFCAVPSANVHKRVGLLSASEVSLVVHGGGGAVTGIVHWDDRHSETVRLSGDTS